MRMQLPNDVLHLWRPISLGCIPPTVFLWFVVAKQNGGIDFIVERLYSPSILRVLQKRTSWSSSGGVSVNSNWSMAATSLFFGWHSDKIIFILYVAGMLIRIVVPSFYLHQTPCHEALESRCRNRRTQLFLIYMNALLHWASEGE